MSDTYVDPDVPEEGLEGPDPEAEEKGLPADPDGSEDAAEADETEAKGEGEENEDDEKPKSRPRKRRAETRIRDLTRRLREAERREAERNEELTKLLASKIPDAAPAETQKGPPDQRDYQDYGEYVADLATWRAEQKVSAELESLRAEQKKTSEKTAAERQEQAMKQKAHSLMVKGRELFEDFDDVAFADDVPMSGAMRDAMLAAEDDAGARVWHYLGENPDVAERICRLSEVAQIKEMARLESRLTRPVQRKGSDAPAPIEPVVGDSKTTRTGRRSLESWDKVPMDEWVKARKAGKIK